MRKFYYLVVLFVFALRFQASADTYEIVTASNDPNNNELLVYGASGQLLQSVATGGQGGVPPHATGGGIAKTETLLAVINYNSQSVSLFKQQQGAFKLIQVIPTISKPVSVTFGNNHLYILGTMTIESHALNGDIIGRQPDGSSTLLIADGSAAQVGFLLNQLIVSQRSDMIAIVELNNGVVTKNIFPVQLPPPPGNNTPVGLVTRGDTAYVTIAHSDAVGLVRNGMLLNVVSSQTQHAPCWLAAMGPWLFCSNTPSKSISRYNISENLVLDELIAAKTMGEPTDIDAAEGIVAVIEMRNTGTALSQFRVDNTGSLKPIGSILTADTANGVAIIKLRNLQP